LPPPQAQNSRYDEVRIPPSAFLPEQSTVAHIKQIPIHEATGRLKQVYDAAGARTGGSVAKILQVMSRDARSLQASMQFYVSLMKSPNALDAARREMLAAVVSNVNECFY